MPTAQQLFDVSAKIRYLCRRKPKGRSSRPVILRLSKTNQNIKGKMKTDSFKSRFWAEVADSRALLHSIPSPALSLFAVSVVAMNLLANKELFSAKWIALDCGYALSWVSFLLMDIICKRFGPKASIKVSVFALILNLAVFLVFHLISLTPGHWGAYYDLSEISPAAALAAEEALNSTFAGSWYVVFGSAVAMLLSSVVNSVLNHMIGRRLKSDGYGAFALRSFVSTFIGQFVDNFTFTTLVSHVFFGWSWLQVAVCALTGSVVELLCEVVFSPLGYRQLKRWEARNVGQEYIDSHSQA